MSELIVRNDSPEARTGAEPSVVFTPRFDIYETEKGFTLTGDLPGVSPNDVEIRFEKKQLIIRGTVKSRQSDVNYLLQEYGIGNFFRSFTLGDTVDATGIQADLKDGVLTIHLPKKAEAQPVRIAVKGG